MKAASGFALGAVAGGLAVLVYHRRLVSELRKGASVAAAFIASREDDVEAWLTAREKSVEAGLGRAWQRLKGRLGL